MTPLQQANHAIIGQDYANAIALYVRVLQQYAPLVQVLAGNLLRAQKGYRAQRAEQGAQKKPHVLVGCWDLSHNAAGRAATLAQIWAGVGKTEIIGFLYPPKKTELWKPIQDFPLPIYPLHVQPAQNFVQQVLDFVLTHPCDLLHLSKPRWPNILLGVIYKLVWACPVWMDIDDEELAFVNADSPIDLGEYLKSGGVLPLSTDSLSSAVSTRLAVGLATAFDQVTVVNPALQHRYGGTIVYHARDGAHFAPGLHRRRQARDKLGIKPEDAVIVFAGTPRAHKGLMETAQAIAHQRCNDLVFLIVGDFPANLSSLQQQIASMSGLRTIMLPNQNFQNLPDVLAAGDICVLLQDANSAVAKYQTPAKLTDALAMGLTVLATPTPALEDLAKENAFIPVADGELSQVLSVVLANKSYVPSECLGSHPIFEKLLSISTNEKKIFTLWRDFNQLESKKMDDTIISIIVNIECINFLSPDFSKALKQNLPYDRFVKINRDIINWEELEYKSYANDLISIVIPIFNQLELTKKCIKSIKKANTKINYEVICVNNGSDTDMDEYLNSIASADQKIRHVKNPENYNFALGCNIGFSKARGSVVVFLNNDTEVTDSWLDNLIAPLESMDIVAAQPKLLYPDRTIQNIGIVFSKNQVFGYPIYANFDSSEPCTNVSRKYQAVTGACMAVRSKDFASVYGFDPIFINGMEDVDLCLRLASGNGKACYYQSSSLVLHHESKTAGRGKFINMNRMNFSKRWSGKIKADDEFFYAADGFKITGWKMDSKEKLLLNIAINRPVLKNIFID